MMKRCASVLVLASVGCGAPQREVAKPKVVAPAETVSPAEQKFRAGQKAGADGDWSAAARLFSEAAALDSSMKVAVVNQGIGAKRER